MECAGGNGYVEEHAMARLYRQAPLNSIWEGSGNVICLDVLRSLRREPRGLDALLRELGAARGMDARLDALVEDLSRELEGLGLRGAAEGSAGGGAGLQAQRGARRLVDRLAVVLQASELVRRRRPLPASAVCSRAPRSFSSDACFIPASFVFVAFSPGCFPCARPLFFSFSLVCSPTTLPHGV
jgi:putative acyl-CoA dehydrogenase